MMKEHAEQGATAMRVFTHSNFDSVKDPIMPDFGKYDESALRRVDLMLAAAAQNGIRIIMVLSNYWPFLGGTQAWVDRALGKGKDKELFYSDSSIRSKFKDWVKKLVTRTNTITGQKYADDPTILSWELQNEPRTSSRYEQSKGKKPGKIICDWVNEMASYVKSLDSNHLVTVGDEGMRVNGSKKEPHTWLNNGNIRLSLCI
jgi:mannan endo-1,4-beta-mannosidase